MTRVVVAAFAVVSMIVAAGRGDSALPAIYVAAAYFVFALTLAGLARWASVRLNTKAAIAIHLCDLACAIVLFVSAVETAALLSAAFVVAAAAWRWGPIAAASTTAAFMAAAAISAVVHRVAPQVADALWPASIGTAGFRAAFIGVVGALIAYFAHADKRRTTDAAIMRAVVGRANLRLGLKATVSMVLATILQRFAARRALVVVHERASGRAFLWETGPQNAAAGEQIRVGSIEPASVATYQFADQSAAWHAIRPRRGDRPFDIVAIDDDSGEVAAPPRTLPASLLAAVGPFDQLISIDISVRDEWNGRLLLLDPRDVGNRARALDGALRLVRDLVPIVHGVYLLRWLRSRSAAAERARVARELHDGAIQAIMGVHMQLHALSVQPDVPRHLASELNRLTGLLQEQGTALRETMQQLKPLDLGPERLIETLAEIVQRFERETGITARFITSLDRVDLSPRACREVTRVVQEALVNVRKHSGAENVYVRLTVVNSQWQLSIDDDGRGFPFTGRKSHPDLLSDRQGPVVIGERVRLLGGQLTLQSEPGRGARLEISLPLASHGIET